MEIRVLRYFLEIAREENMTRASHRLHVSQPTLSKQIKDLEDELGKKLFTRHSFSIKLTDEGMLLRDRAEDLIAMADKIEQEFISLDDITGGDIYFGLGESYQIALLAREIKKLKDRYPSFTYHITSGDTEQVTEKLDKGILDFGVSDPANMGAAMAPAAYDTLRALFRDTQTAPQDYDLIVTGDLGHLGHAIVTDLFARDGVDLGGRYDDCGRLLFDRKKQDMHCGGSGAGCSASVLCAHLLRGMREGKWKRIVFAPTGALLSPTSTFQGETIPGICHAVVFENKA